MSSPISVANIKLFDARLMSANISSSPFHLEESDLYTVQHVWSGASGTITVYVEATCTIIDPQDTDYTPIDTYIISSATGNRMLNVEKAGYPLVRTRLVQTSGAGTISSTINVKVI